MLTALYHSPYTGNSNWTNCPGIFPHNVVLRKVITGCQVVSGPLARCTRRAGELISQVFMRLTGCTDPAAVLTWETGTWTAECDSLRFFKRRCCWVQYVDMTKKNIVEIQSPTCLHFLHLITFAGVAALWGGHRFSGPVNQIAAQTQTFCPLTYWHVTVTIARALVAEDVVSAHAVPLGIKLHYCLTARWRERGCGGWEDTKKGKERDKMSGKKEIKAKQSPTIIPLMSHWCLLKAAVRTETISHGQLSLRSPEQTVKGITIVFSLLKTSQLQKYLLRGYKCLVCLVMSECINGLPSFPQVT